MKRLAVIMLLTLSLASPALGQAVTLNTPTQPTNPEASYQVKDFMFINTCSCFLINISVQDSNGVELRIRSVRVPDSTFANTATLGGFGNAVFINARTGETGTWARKANFRIVGYLADSGYFGASGSYTVNP